MLPIGDELSRTVIAEKIASGEATRREMQLVRARRSDRVARVRAALGASLIRAGVRLSPGVSRADHASRIVTLP